MLINIIFEITTVITHAIVKKNGENRVTQTRELELKWRYVTPRDFFRIY